MNRVSNGERGGSSTGTGGGWGRGGERGQRERASEAAPVASVAVAVEPPSCEVAVELQAVTVRIPHVELPRAPGGVTHRGHLRHPAAPQLLGQAVDVADD